MGRPTNAGEPASNRSLDILDAALRLFAERGADATSMNEIALAVGIRKPTLYHYYPSKDAILQAIFSAAQMNSGWVRDEMTRSNAPLADRLAMLGEHFIARMRERPYWQAVMIRESIGGNHRPGAGDVRNNLHRHIQSRIDTLAEIFAEEFSGLSVRDAESIAGHFFHSLTGFWLFEGHVAATPPSAKRCTAYVRNVSRMVALQLSDLTGTPVT